MPGPAHVACHTGPPPHLRHGEVAHAAHQLLQDFSRCPQGLAFNALLFRSFRLALWFAALLSAGAVLGRLVA